MRHVSVFFLGALVLAGCATTPLPTVRFPDTEPVSSATVASAKTKPLRIAMAAVISPKGNVESYSALLEYIGAKLNRPIELVQRMTYAEVNELLQGGDADIAFVCTSAYVIGQREFGMELLVAPQVRGETVYYSLLIVPADSPARSLQDLRGKTFAFTDPLSLTGRLYPTQLVSAFQTTPEEFFERTFFTYSHDNAIRAVASGVADGANVDNLVYEFLVAREPSIGKNTRVIHRSPPFGIPPVVVNPKLDPQLKLRLREILIQADWEEQGQRILQDLMIDRFVVVSDHIYDSAREMELQVNTAP